MSDTEISAKVLRFEKVDSTNNKAKEIARSEVCEGAVIVAKEQTEGRGTGVRKWHSPEGGLYLSMILKPRKNSNLADVAILAGVAVVQAIRTLLPKSVEVGVKWPNDCLLQNKKVAGILCETLGKGRERFCVVGIGVNVNVSEAELAPFQSNPFGATSIMVESGHSPVDLERVTEVVIAKLLNLYKLYREEGFQPIQYLWERNCDFVGKKVELAERDLSESDRKRGTGLTVGHCLGIDEEGAIVITNDKGERRSYYTGEITCCWPST